MKKRQAGIREKTVSLDPELCDRVDEMLLDHKYNKPKYGGWSGLVARLLREWLDDQATIPLISIPDFYIRPIRYGAYCTRHGKISTHDSIPPTRSACPKCLESNVTTACILTYEKE